MKVRNRGPLIGDVARNAAVEYIGLAYAHGYLPLDEMQERLELANTARYEYQLDLAQHDLPEELETPEPEPTPAAIVSNDDVDDETPLGVFMLLIAALIALFVFMCWAGHVTRQIQTPPDNFIQHQEQVIQHAQPIPSWRCHNISGVYLICEKP